jgi:hypothetical protein
MMAVRNMVGALGLVAAMVINAALISRAGEPAVLARVGGETVTGDELDKVIAYRKLHRLNPAEDLRQLKALLDEAIVEHLIKIEASGISLKDKPDVTVRVRQAEITAAGELYGIDHILPQYRLDSVTIDTFYQAHVGRYTAAHDQRRIRQITVFHPGRGVPRNATTYIDSLYDGWDQHRKIDSLYTRLAMGEDFALLVGRHSEDPHTRGTGGDMGWITPQSVAEGEFSQHCFTQALHLISRPFESNLGWHIVQVTGIRPAGPLPLDLEIHADIVSQLTEMQSKQIARGISDSLMAAGSLEYVGAAIALPDDQLRPQMPLAVANGRDTIWALEYLGDRLHWIKVNQGKPLGIEERKNVIHSEYYKHMCWYTMLRELGYLDRPEISSVRAHMLATERESIVELQLTATGYDPDEASITRYYDTHGADLGTPPPPLSQVRNMIRSKLKAERNARAQREWIQRMTARYGVERFDDHLATVKLPS